MEEPIAIKHSLNQIKILYSKKHLITGATMMDPLFRLLILFTTVVSIIYLYDKWKARKIAKNSTNNKTDQIKSKRVKQPTDTAIKDQKNISKKSLKPKITKKSEVKKFKPKNGYVKVYASSVPNTRVSLDKKVSVSVFIELVLNPQKKGQLQKLGEVYMWDFGVRATKYFKSGDELWIVTGDVAYETTLAFVIKNEGGEIGDAIGWYRQFKQPWKNVAILSSCKKHALVPSWLRSYLMGQEQSLIQNFYEINISNNKRTTNQ